MNQRSIDYRRALASLLAMAFFFTMLGGSCTKTTITVIPTLGNPGSLQISGIGFGGANKDGRCTQVALIGLGPPAAAVIPLGPQPICSKGAFGMTWTYGSNPSGPCAPTDVVVTATDTDPATPVIGSQATQISACAPCGALGLPACTTGTPCFSGSVAPDGSCECGSRNEACCNDTQCGGGTACFDGVCRCGGVGQPCCDGGCDSNLSCVPGPRGAPTCACGTAGLPCCNGSVCNAPGSVCLDGIRCEPCGKQGGPCCAGNRCSAGYGCFGGMCQCGLINQPCCNGSCSSATTGNPQCNVQSNTCVAGGSGPPPPPCRTAGQSCGTSTGPFCCAGDLLCNGGTCTSCIEHSKVCPQSGIDICCTFGDMCALDQASGNTVCKIP